MADGDLVGLKHASRLAGSDLRGSRVRQGLSLSRGGMGRWSKFLFLSQSEGALVGEVQERAEGDLTLAGGVPLPQTGILPPHPHALHPVCFPQSIYHSLSCIEELFNVCLLVPPLLACKFHEGRFILTT